jgi:hypothetical protein
MKNIQKIHKSWIKEAKKFLKCKNINENDENNISTEAFSKEEKKERSLLIVIKLILYVFIFYLILYYF